MCIRDRSQLLDQGRGPGARAHVEQTRGRGVGHLGARLAGQPVADQVGDEQHRGGLVEPVGQQLVDRVERQHLQPRHVVQLLRPDRAGHPLGDAPRAVVAVVHRVSQQRARLVEQPVVHRPRVDADGGDGPGGAQAGQDLPVEAEDVPVEAARHPYGAVGEAVRLGQAEPVGQVGQHHPAAGGAQVDGGETAAHCVDSLATSSGWNMMCWCAWVSGLAHSSSSSSVAIRPSWYVGCRIELSDTVEAAAKSMSS